MKRIFASSLVAAALCGCNTMNLHEPVPGWPAMKVIEHHVSVEEVRDRCSRFVPFPAGCTVFLFDRSEAHISISM